MIHHGLGKIGEQARQKEKQANVSFKYTVIFPDLLSQLASF